MRVMNSVFRIENDILLLNTYFNSQIYKKKFTYHQILALIASSKTGYVFLIESLAQQASHTTEFPHQNYKNNPTLMLSYTPPKNKYVVPISVSTRTYNCHLTKTQNSLH